MLAVLRGKAFCFCVCFLDLFFVCVSVLPAGFKSEAECASNGQEPHHTLPHCWDFPVIVHLVFSLNPPLLLRGTTAEPQEEYQDGI